MAEPTAMFIETVDKAGTPITVFSTQDPANTEAFAKAIDNYDNDKTPTPGFITLPSNSMQGKIRTSFEEGPGKFGRETLPNVGEALGGMAATSPIMLMLQKAGLINPQTGQGAVQAGRTVGRGTGELIGSQIDTPPELGMAIGTGAASKMLSAPTSAAGRFLPANWIANALTAGGLGAGGSTTLRAATGEEISPGQMGVDSGMAALSNGLSGVVSHFITKFVNRNMQEKVAKEIVDSFKERYPNLTATDNIMDIAASSPQQVSRIAQQMTKGLRGGMDVPQQEIIDQLNTTLPSALSKGQKISLQGNIRRLVNAQNKQLDAIGNEQAFNEATSLIAQRTDELVEAVKGLYPKVKNIDAVALRVEGVLNNYTKQLSNFQEGARVIHTLRRAGAQEKFDPKMYADMIRGEYETNPGSQLELVGNILNQGRKGGLQASPRGGQYDPQSEFGAKAYNFARGVIPGMSRFTNPIQYKGPQVPWEGKKVPMEPLINFGAQQSGQAAIRSFLESKEQ